MARRTVNLPFQTGSITIPSNTAVQGTIDLLNAGLTNLGINSRPGMTIVRIRGYMNVGLATDVGISQNVQVAIMVVPEGGLAQVPDITVEVINAFWRADVRTRGQVSEDSAGSFVDVEDVYQVESEGKRKITRANDEVRIFARTAVGSSMLVNVSGTIRVMLE